MTTHFWKAPSEALVLEDVNKVEIFRIKDRKIVPEDGWPSAFWSHSSDVIELSELELSKVLVWFSALQLDEPARCHMPPWGLAFYSDNVLLYTATICFECSNSYIYSAAGKVLTAFNVSEANAIALLEYLNLTLPLE